MQPPTCPYCGAAAVLVDSKVVYHSKSYGMIWICFPCDAYVGVHKNSGNVPLGRLANAELRMWKRKAHAAFDPLWRDNGPLKRQEAYRRLSEVMGIPRSETHIGMFDVDQCQSVIDAVGVIQRGIYIPDVRQLEFW